MFTPLSLVLMLMLGLAFAKPAASQPRVGVSINFQTFYDELSPYGDWIDYPDYGYSWRPRLGGDFRPYSTNGYWLYTDVGDWMWNSNYDWGWGPFHYGRWFYDPFYGWLWVPGYDWSPAWVAWRGGGDYYGWAPLRPGISINIGIGRYNPPYDYWTFAPSRYMSSRYIDRYYYPYQNNVTIINNTTIINNYGNRSYGGRYDRAAQNRYYSNGPLRSDVERYTGRIQSVRYQETSRPGRASLRGDAVNVYRPTVQRERAGDRTTYAPRNVESYDRSLADRGNVLRGRERSATIGQPGSDRNPAGNERVRGDRSRVGVPADQSAGNARQQRNDNNNMRQREQQMNEQRSSEMRQRQQEQVNRQRNDQGMRQREQEQVNRQRNDQGMRQREQQMNEQRSSEMRQRQQEQVNRQRNDRGMRQREQQMNEQRSSEMRQRQQEQVDRQRQQEQAQQQRNNEMAQQRQEQAQQQRAMERSQRQAEAAPQRESRSREMQAPRQDSRNSGDRGDNMRGRRF